MRDVAQVERGDEVEQVALHQLFGSIAVALLEGVEQRVMGVRFAQGRTPLPSALLHKSGRDCISPFPGRI